jgi:hypothetical protein
MLKDQKSPRKSEIPEEGKINMATDPGKNINTFLNHIKKLEE